MSKCLIKIDGGRLIDAEPDEHVFGNGEVYPVFGVITITDMEKYELQDVVNSGAILNDLIILQTMGEDKMTRVDFLAAISVIPPEPIPEPEDNLADGTLADITEKFNQLGGAQADGTLSNLTETFNKLLEG